MYFDYVRLLRSLLIIVPPIVGALALVASMIDGDQSVTEIVLGVVGSVVMAAIQVGFWTTLGFALFEHASRDKPIPSRSGWSPDDLDELPADRQISLGETLFTVGFYAVVITLVPFKWLNPTIETASGNRVPTFLPSLWDGWVWYIVALFAAMLVLDVVKYRVGHWTWPMAWANLALNLGFAIPVVALLVSDRIVNPDAIDALGLHLEWDTPEQVLTVSAAVIILISLWDTVEAFWRAHQAARRDPLSRAWATEA